MAHVHELIDFVVTAFIVHNQKLLFVNHIKLDMWLPPGGHIELDEDPDEALRRELFEETGLDDFDYEVVGEILHLEGDTAKPLLQPRFMDIHRIQDPKKPGHRHVALCYVVKASTADVKLAPGEHADIRWVGVDELHTLDLLPHIRQYAEIVLAENKE